MGKALGINMINMYEKMIKDDFGPLIARLIARTAGVREKVEQQVKKDMGVYPLYEEKAALELRIHKIKRKLEHIEKETWNVKQGEWESLLNTEVRMRLTELNQPLATVTAARDKLIRGIRLSGVTNDIKHVFEALPEILAELNGKFGFLPELTDADIRGLGNGVYHKNKP